MDKPKVEQSIQMVPLQVTMIKQDLEVPESLHSDEGTHVRIVGCDGKRQAIVEHYHGSLVIKERGKPDGHVIFLNMDDICLLYTSPSPRDRQKSRMPSSA